MTASGLEDREAVVGEGGFSLPVLDVLTGRGFVTGKSGSGKSSTATVVLEELLEQGAPVLVVDLDGEYWGLKEEYEVLHLGAGEDCDAVVGPEHAALVADTVLGGDHPVILDVSGFLDESAAAEVVEATLRECYRAAKAHVKPALIVVEEIHEYIPQRGSGGDLGEVVIRIAKRGRKRGLGLCGLSQRPAAVDKDFITQCDWIVWHRLTWQNDTRVVGKILGGDAEEAVQDLDAGQALVMTDWDESVHTVQFRRRRTYDAGATPGLGGEEPPPLRRPAAGLVEQFEEIEGSTGDDRSEVEVLRDRLREREARVEELEATVERLRAESGGGDGAEADEAELAEPAPDAPARGRPEESFNPLWEFGQMMLFVLSLPFRLLGGLFAAGDPDHEPGANGDGSAPGADDPELPPGELDPDADGPVDEHGEPGLHADQPEVVIDGERSGDS